MQYDIFISYKRRSLPTANNLYYRLKMRGYSVFFDLEEMRRSNFDEQIYDNIHFAKDFFVILEESSLNSCLSDIYQNDWFCREIAFALKENKNIIPVLLDGYKMPSEESLPPELKELSKKNALEFSYAYFDDYIDKLISKGYLTATAKGSKENSVFKFTSTEDCDIYENEKLVCSLNGMDEMPYYLFIKRKGEYRYKCVNKHNKEAQLVSATIDLNEEKFVDIIWKRSQLIDPEKTVFNKKGISGEKYTVEIANFKFNMVRADGGTFFMGATDEQAADAEPEEEPQHPVTVGTFYMSEFPIVQCLWEYVMGYNQSHFKEEPKFLIKDGSRTPWVPAIMAGAGSILLGSLITVIAGLGRSMSNRVNDTELEYQFLPAESISFSEAEEFVARLSRMTNLDFSIPTEEEWEFAARGGLKTKHFKYSGSDNIDEVAWYRGNSGGETRPVGLKKPNELGIYDMSGNVWEWTKTHPYNYVLPNEHNGGEYYIRRGGSWWHEDKNCRVSKRYVSRQSKRTSGLGFRVVIRINEK
jgi:formylglycine-generating enzyme required for sulfatase activity